jgi:hypothetical protein
MNKYAKKPITIEAIEFIDTSECIIAIQEFTGLDPLTVSYKNPENPELYIPTLEDGAESQVKHVASVGDFIIKGIQGEFYPCKPDIFWLTYNKV